MYTTVLLRSEAAASGLSIRRLPFFESPPHPLFPNAPSRIFVSVVRGVIASAGNVTWISAGPPLARAASNASLVSTVAPQPRLPRAVAALRPTAARREARAPREV